MSAGERRGGGRTGAQHARALSHASFCRVVVHATPVWAHADPTRLQQIIINLLTNAAKYTPPEKVITLSVECQDGLAVIRVADEGIGIDPAALPYVMDLFYQSSAPADRAGGGLGIGLSVVRRLAELHGGDVAIRSEGAGLGCTAVVRLPAIAAPTAPAPSPTRRTRAPTVATQRRVPVVEDNHDTREMIREALELEGHRVYVAEDGGAAVRVAKTIPLDVALVDIGLPVMGGYEVAKLIRPNDRTSPAMPTTSL